MKDGGLKTDTPITDHDLLIRIDERTRKLDKCMANHLATHQRLLVAVITVGLAALVSAIVSVVTR